MPKSARFVACCVVFSGLCLSVIGCGGNTGASTSTPVNPVTTDFTVSAHPSQVSITAGTTSTFTLSISWTGTPVGAISLTPTYPNGISAGQTFPATIPAGNNSASVTLTASATAPAGSTQLSISATATGASTITHTYTIPITIAVPPPPPIPTLTRTGYILTGGDPQGIVYDTTRKFLWVSVPDLGQVLVIDPAKRKILNRIPVPLAGDMDLSLDGTQIVVGSNTVPLLTFIDVASQSVIRKALFTTDDVIAGYSAFRPSVAATDDPVNNPVIAHPRFVAGGDVVFLGFGGLFRWFSATNTIARTKGGNFYFGMSLSRTPDGSRVLITTTENELDVYNPATDSLSAQNQTTTPFGAADPVNPRFAIYDSTNGFDIVDVNLNHLGSAPANTLSNSRPYASEFSHDGSQLFVAQSGLFNGPYVLQSVDAVNFKLGAQAPITNFNGSVYLDAEIPLAIDETNRMFGIGIGGVVIDDPLNTYKSQPIPFGPFVKTSLAPNFGAVATSPSLSLNNPPVSLQSVYFDGVPATLSVPPSPLTVTAPPIQTPGPVTVEAFQSNGSFSQVPAAYTYGAQAVALEPTAGPASGGITAALLAYGVSGGPSTVSVTVGGASATVQSVTQVGGAIPYILPLYYVQFVVPPGTAGSSADVSITASGYTATLPRAFTYEPAITNYPFPSSTIPNSILFDAHRQQAYLLSPTRIDVFSLKSNSFLAPIIPPSKSGTLALTGLDLSVDGKTMIVADMKDQTLALLDPDNPTNANLVSFGFNQNGSPFGPRYVVANRKGTYFVSSGDTVWTGGGGIIWEFNPVGNTFTQRVGPLDAVLEVSGSRLARSADGTIVLVQTPNSIPASLVTWHAATDRFTPRNLPGLSYDGAVSPDGSLISALVDPETGILYQYALDSSQNVLASMSDPDWLHTGWLWGQFFDPSNTLFYVPDNVGLDIYDVHSGHLQRKIGVKEAPNTSVYTAATSDNTGNTLLLLTNNGLDVIQDVPPLAVASVSPLPNSAGAGNVITVKGTNFVAGATITIGGQTVPGIVSDSHTLTFSLPAVVAGNTLTITNPDGATYTY